MNDPLIRDLEYNYKRRAIMSVNIEPFNTFHMEAINKMMANSGWVGKPGKISRWTLIIGREKCTEGCVTITPALNPVDGKYPWIIMTYPKATPQQVSEDSQWNCDNQSLKQSLYFNEMLSIVKEETDRLSN